MATVSDARFDALRVAGYTGSTSDMLLQWLAANSGLATPGKTIADAWKVMLLEQTGLPESGYQRNTYWFTLLGTLGYTGSLNDRELAFWVAGGSFNPQELELVTDDDGTPLTTDDGQVLEAR